VAPEEWPKAWDPSPLRTCSGLQPGMRESAIHAAPAPSSLEEPALRKPRAQAKISLVLATSSVMPQVRRRMAAPCRPLTVCKRAQDTLFSRLRLPARNVVARALSRVMPSRSAVKSVAIRGVSLYPLVVPLCWCREPYKGSYRETG
jgi:hypothetical protein